jgi:hypothetical protein
MNDRDRALLEKQLHSINPDPQAGTLVAIVIAVFLVGVTFGSLLVSADEPMRVASLDTPPPSAQLFSVAPFSRE